MKFKVYTSSSGAKQLIVPIAFYRSTIPLPMRKSKVTAVIGTALIDTGATHTAIIESIPLSMGLIPIGKVITSTAADSLLVCNQYLMKLTFSDNKKSFDNIRVLALPEPIASIGEEIHCLFGMDILQQGRFVCDGDEFEITFPP